jgi:uncharacterized membrane protein
MNSKSLTTLWLRWVAANGVGEMLGLGLTFVVGVVVISRLGNQQSVTVILLSFLVAVVSGTIEATLIGLAQWWAMYPWFFMISRKQWWLATLVGALVAYVLGYLPSTLMSLAEQASQTQSATVEPEQWMVMLLAAALGAVGGAVLSFAQWLVLRRHVGGAAVWIPANMLAWLVGMPLIFWGIDSSQKLDGLPWQILFLGMVLLLAGMVVGAIHGVFLTRLAKGQGS